MKAPVSSSETSLRNALDLYTPKWHGVLQDTASITFYICSRNRTDCFGILPLILFKHGFQRLWTNHSTLNLVSYLQTHIFLLSPFETLLKNTDYTDLSFRNSKLKHTLIRARRHKIKHNKGLLWPMNLPSVPALVWTKA